MSSNYYLFTCDCGKGGQALFLRHGNSRIISHSLLCVNQSIGKCLRIKIHEILNPLAESRQNDWYLGKI